MQDVGSQSQRGRARGREGARTTPLGAVPAVEVNPAAPSNPPSLPPTLPGAHRQCRLHRLAQVPQQQLDDAGGVGGGDAQVQRGGALQRVEVPAVLAEQVVHLVDVQAPAGRQGGREGGKQERKEAKPAKRAGIQWLAAAH